MGATKIRSVNKDEWKRIKTEFDPEYRHVGGEWVVRKIHIKGYRTKYFCGIYIGPTRTDPPKLPPTDTLSESQTNVANWIVDDRENTSPRNRAIRAQAAGDSSLVLDCIFDHIDEKFEELRRDLDDRMENLKISFQ